jgi:hypothetical protein
LSLRDLGLCVIYVNSDVFGVGLSELIFFFEQRTYQNDDGEMGRFIGLYGSRRAAAGLKMLARRRQKAPRRRPLIEPNVSQNYLVTQYAAYLLRNLR